MMEKIPVKKLLSMLDAEKYVDETGRYGLYGGYGGLAMICYLFARETGEGILQEKAQILLEEVSTHISTADDLSFSTGLTGIGWVVEWLVQNELLKDTNTDEVLEGIDDVLYKQVMFDRDHNMSLASGTLGKIAYFLKRELSENPNTHHFRRIYNQECLTVLIDDLEEGLSGDKGLLHRKDVAQVDPIDLAIPAVSLIVTASITTVNATAAEKILYDSARYAEDVLAAFLKEKVALDPDLSLAMLYLAVCYLIAGNIHQQPHWISTGRKYIRTLSRTIAPSEQLNEVQLYRKLAVLSLVQVHCQSAQNLREIENLITKLAAAPANFSLLNGLGTIWLAELGISHPGIIDNWHEILLIA